MLKEKFAFEFHSSVYSKNEIEKLSNHIEARRKPDIHLNMSYKVVERATSLTECVSTLCNCFVEGKKTRELAKRISYAKKALDNMVNQEYVRAQAEISEFMLRSEERIKYMEKQLQLNKVEIQKLADLEKKKFENRYEIEKSKKEFIIKTRRELKETLDKTSEILEYTHKVISNKNDKRLLQVNENYRECLKDYKQMLNINI